MGNESLTDVSQCDGCGAPLSTKPTLHHPVKCEYCDLTNYLKRSAITPDETEVIDQEAESEHYYLIYQESQKILENFPGELVGDEVGKIRIKMQVGEYAFPILIVLDDLPEQPYIDLPSKLQEILNYQINELKTMKEWIPGSSSVLDVLEEIYKTVEVSLPPIMDKTYNIPAKKTLYTQEDHDPLVNQILSNYDTSISKKEISVRFYAQDGEIINFIIKRKKNYPIGLESEILTRYPLIRGPLEDYSKGRIDLITTLAEIERLLYI